ncbi:protein SEMI-ROLLED LEAF 2 isoform X2 [Impatiens glandulifera]|uniref:protein SEMI-ROLLED LEAF 2 isoform X2 n=1 Tax=Impatiens glandulifera TaxID=253017 RepID=UPI001FB065BC|nr:protein SEMI-ROLLED LEAF 2 isoform X2 [Impatiens glandulifera]
MGVISRKIFPACESMCICCPALRSRSRQPVKRYKKLLAEIFPKSNDELPNERKIVKLCEYAAKNPFRIPKIAEYLEERCYKELRNDHVKFITIVGETYNKLISMCREQMVYFVVSLLNVVTQLLDSPKQNVVRIIGCQTLTRFIYSQVDGTYTHNIENMVQKVCMLARETGQDSEKCSLRASSMQCLSAMMWFMVEFSYVFDDLDEIVSVTLDNYEPNTQSENDDEKGEPHHNWVDEVVRCEARNGGVAGSELMITSSIITRLRPEKKDASLLTREEIEDPKVWAQICIQRMVELAKESSTMRRVLDPIFVCLDTKRQWIPRQSLSTTVLSDMCYFTDNTVSRQLVLALLVHHLDHKNVYHDPQIKSNIIQIATGLVQQIRSEGVITDIGFVSDLCRHLRKSLQATSDSVGEQELNMNITLQNAIENCLLETAKGIVDARPLFDMMALTMEKLPSVRDVARSTIGSMIILAHTFSLVSSNLLSQQVFPEALLVQLLKAMLHPDPQVCAGAHQIFSALIIPNSNHTKKWQSHETSAYASVTVLLERLRKETDGTKIEKQGITTQDDSNKDIESAEEEWKNGRAHRSSPSFLKLSSIVDKTSGMTNSTEGGPSVMKFNEDQIAQLLSAFWVQANCPDNLPSNIEAIAHSFCLTLISVRLKSPNNNLVVRFFQLPLSLRNMALDPNYDTWSPSYRRLVLVLSTAMLMFAAKNYQISDLPLVESDIDPYVGISGDYQLYLKPRANLKKFGSDADNQVALASLSELGDKLCDSDEVLVNAIAQSLSCTFELEVSDLVGQLLEAFTPDDAFVFGPHSLVDFSYLEDIMNSSESLSSDMDFATNSAIDDAQSESSVTDLSRFIPKLPVSPLTSHVIGVGQLLESALEVAGHVAGSSVSTSPLPYSIMANQCETFGTCSRQKLCSWLSYESNHYSTTLSSNTNSESMKMSDGGDDDDERESGQPAEPWLALRLPPASPFDNFLRAARF